MDAHDQETQQQESYKKADRWSREQPTETVRIETHQSQLLKTNQSRRSIMLYKVSRNQSTSSPDEDYASFVPLWPCGLVDRRMGRGDNGSPRGRKRGFGSNTSSLLSSRALLTTPFTLLPSLGSLCEGENAIMWCVYHPQLSLTSSSTRSTKI